MRMTRLTMLGASLILLAIAADAGCRRKNHLDVSSKKTQMEPEITAEQARAALLKLDGLPRYHSGEDDPILVDLKYGVVARPSNSVVRFGKIFSCNLKEKTWHMRFSNNAANPRWHFSTGANGKFEYQSDGTWRAIKTGYYIT